MALTVRMVRHAIRWLLPLIALALFAAYLVISPIMASHAAPVTSPAPAQISAPAISSHGITPNRYWRP